MNNSIKIISPFYNPGDFLDNCVASLMSQNYDNYKIIFIDDCSTDNSFEKLPLGHPKAMVIKNAIRKTALENIYDAIINHCKPDDIVCLCDADDFLVGKNCLSYINNIYNKGLGGINKVIEDEEIKNYPENIRKTNKVFMSYGKCQWSDGRKCFASPYSKEEFLNIKYAPYRVSHLRTFRASAFFEIIKQCPDLSCFKDNNGEFYKSGYDTAIWIPLLQICSYEHTYFNSKILYYYNLHPNNDHAINQTLQTYVHNEALKKQSFQQVNF